MNSELLFPVQYLSIGNDFKKVAVIGRFDYNKYDEHYVSYKKFDNFNE